MAHDDRREDDPNVHADAAPTAGRAGPAHGDEDRERQSISTSTDGAQPAPARAPRAARRSKPPVPRRARALAAARAMRGTALGRVQRNAPGEAGCACERWCSGGRAGSCEAVRAGRSGGGRCRGAKEARRTIVDVRRLAVSGLTSRHRSREGSLTERLSYQRPEFPSIDFYRHSTQPSRSGDARELLLIAPQLRALDRSQSALLAQTRVHAVRRRLESRLLGARRPSSTGPYGRRHGRRPESRAAAAPRRPRSELLLQASHCGDECPVLACGRAAGGAICSLGPRRKCSASAARTRRRPPGPRRSVLVGGRSPERRGSNPVTERDDCARLDRHGRRARLGRGVLSTAAAADEQSTARSTSSGVEHARDPMRRHGTASHSQEPVSRSAPLGLYVHVPFCAARCGYCDFNTYTAAELPGGGDRAGFADGRAGGGRARPCERSVPAARPVTHRLLRRRHAHAAPTPGSRADPGGDP